MKSQDIKLHVFEGKKIKVFSVMVKEREDENVWPRGKAWFSQGRFPLRECGKGYGHHVKYWVFQTWEGLCKKLSSALLSGNS